MLPLISAAVVLLIALRLTRLLPVMRKHRQQVRFIRETLTANRTFDNRRVIESLSTVHDRINNLSPDAKMIHAKDLREPRPVAVITGCGSYLVRPRFFINRSGIIQEPHPLRFILMTFGSAHGSAAAA
jgi:hypothetical protein